MRKKEQKIAEFFRKKIKEFSSGKDEWTLYEFASFRNWMVDYLMTHKGVRNITMNDPQKKNVESFVDSYIKMNGLPIKS